MPRKPIDYSNTTIYKLCCNDLEITDVYVGHTTDFTKRKYNHKSLCNTETSKRYNFYVYQFIRDHGGWSNWSMIEIEKICCIDSNDALKQERRCIELLGATLNKNLPTRTKSEWGEDNKEHIKEYHKQYREENKDHIKEKNKEYYEQNKEQLKEKVKQYYEANTYHIKEKNKEYREANKEHIKEKIKQYYEDNKEHIKEKIKQYNEANKEHIKEKQKEYREANKEKQKEYREANKEHIKEYKKQYYEAHKSNK